MVAYISGPITGKLFKNVFMFEIVHMILTVAGVTTVVPTHLEAGGALTQDEYMFVWVNVIPTCTTMVMLPGWQYSRGATAEHALAHELGIRTVDLLGREV